MQVKTFIGLLLTAVLALTLVPTAALADGALTVTGGVENTDYQYVDDGKRVIVLTSTPLTISGRPSAASVVINTGVEANLTLENATIKTAGGSAIHLFSGAKLNLTLIGDNILTGTQNYAGLDVREGQTLVITKESTGTLDVTSGKHGAGIGGGDGQSGGTIIIQGGTVKATGSNSGAGAGIGGGYNGNGGTISIHGGTIEARGGWWGAGIGGGAADGGTITISGGTVKATAVGGGSGIGGGLSGDGGHISISGGTVNVVGETGGAGIGGGWGGDGGNITISGGTVNAVSESAGAGIGGGWNGSGAELKVTGGVVFANATSGPMDVGAGTFYPYPDNPDEIILTDGSLEISGDAALFLKNGTCSTPTTSTHTKEDVIGHAANSAIYGIPVPWSGDFSAYLWLSKLTYDPNGGNGALMEVIQRHGTVTTTASGNALNRTGYAFSIWNTASNGGGTDFAVGETFSFPEQDVTLFAKWTANAYTVNYDPNGGEGTTEASRHTYDVEQELTPNRFTRAGYRFAGWAASAEGPAVYKNRQRVLNLTADDDGAVTLYAQWAEPEPTPAPSFTPMGTIVNCISGVNVRSGPGTNYRILGLAPKGAVYTVIEKIGAWYKVDFNGKVGYISSRYLAVTVSEQLPQPTSSAPLAGQGMVVNCKRSVNVRSGPGTRYSILGYAQKGAVYTIISKAGSWYKIEFSSRTAYISADFFLEGNG